MITVRPETATLFEIEADAGEIDLQALAAKARSAVEQSRQTIAQAKSIADGNWLERWLSSGKLQASLLATIGHVRDMSEINIALSAVCNDLALQGLAQGQRVEADSKHIHKQLQETQRTADTILDHLEALRDSPLARAIVPGDSTSPTPLASLLTTTELQLKALRSDAAALRENLAGQVAEANERINAKALEVHDALAQMAHKLGETGTNATKRMDEIVRRFKAGEERSKLMIADTVANIAALEGAYKTAVGNLRQTFGIETSSVARAIAAETELREHQIADLSAQLKAATYETSASLRKVMRISRKELLVGTSALLLLQTMMLGYFAHLAGLW